MVIMHSPQNIIKVDDDLRLLQKVRDDVARIERTVDEESIQSIQDISNEIDKNIQKLSNEYGTVYAPITKDFWFRHMTDISNKKIPEAFIRTILALTCRHFDTDFLYNRMVEVQSVDRLDTKFSDRKIETDFACVADFKRKNSEIESKKKQVEYEYNAITTQLKQGLEKAIEKPTVLNDSSKNKMTTRRDTGENLQKIHKLAMKLKN